MNVNPFRNPDGLHGINDKVGFEQSCFAAAAALYMYSQNKANSLRRCSFSGCALEQRNS